MCGKIHTDGPVKSTTGTVGTAAQLGLCIIIHHCEAAQFPMPLPTFRRYVKSWRYERLPPDYRDSAPPKSGKVLALRIGVVVAFCAATFYVVTRIFLSLGPRAYNPLDDYQNMWALFYAALLDCLSWHTEIRPRSSSTDTSSPRRAGAP
jgi:hypothetical protein